MKKSQILTCVTFFASIIAAEGGRLVQEEMSLGQLSKEKPFIQEAPNDLRTRRRLHQQEQRLIGESSTSATNYEGGSLQDGNMPQKKVRRNKFELTDHRLMKAIPTHSKQTGNDILGNNFKALFDGSNEKHVRKKRQWNLPAIDLPRYFFKVNLTTPKYPYGVCHVSLGYNSNPRCIQGEVCVDKDTRLKVECPAGTTCAACAPSAPPPPCPRGCPPGSGCPALTTGSEDGVCSDPVREDDEYYVDLSSTTIMTPGVFYQGSLGKGAECNVYGDLIDETQHSALDWGEKSKRLKTSSDTNTLGGSMCNWAQARLQCIPNKPRISTTTIAPLTAGDIEESKRIEGTCQCMLSLGEKAVAIAPEENENVAICYIPANKGTYSNCGHDIYPPYGIIVGVRKDGMAFHRGSDPASKFCVPNSECRAGYKYTGVRCQCKKKARWDPRTYTCSRATEPKRKNLLSTVFKIGVYVFAIMLL